MAIGFSLFMIALGAIIAYAVRVRGLDRVALHADLTILAKLACALSRARAAPLAA